MTLAFEFRPGLRVRYHPAEDPLAWRTGTLVRASVNGEEWLVKGERGSFWLAYSRIQPVPEHDSQ